jgi:cadmium resistance protein CadD (predicted permease)
VGIAVWCATSFLLVSHKQLVDLLQRYSPRIIPAVHIALGVYILARSGLQAQIG